MNNRPLERRRIVVTRAPNQNKDFVRELKKLGAVVIECPSIIIRPILKNPRLQRILASLKKSKVKYDWIIILSANGVKYFSYHLRREKVGTLPIPVCVIGPATEKVAEKEGFFVRKVAREYNFAKLVKTLGKLAGKKILIPRVKGGPADVVRKLQHRGAIVDEIFVYETILAPQPPPHLKRRLLSGVDVVTFTSPSTVRNFCQFFRRAERIKLFKKCFAASIGPSTTKEIKSRGIPRFFEAKKATTEAMIHSLKRYFSS